MAVKKIQDHYFKEARKQGYAARSAFKLEEMDRKFRLLRKGQRVLDLGCAPGSWLQYAAKRVLPEGSLTGVDLKPVNINLPDQVRTFQKDIYMLDETIFELSQFDLVLSDMAPDTTGIPSVDSQRSYDLNAQALMLAKRHLTSGGTLVLKAFQGEPLNQLKSDFRSCFNSLKLFKPKSSRSESVEIYLLGFGMSLQL
jgi:23S rRNA (uridine2552-2'-O)-methyltransferase